ncbi:MAG: TrbI/VirB10 family protein [Pseudomonadota bacterium]
MSDDPNQADVSERLARLEAGHGASPVTAMRRSPLMALLVVALIGLAGIVLYLLNQPEEDVVLPTATPDEFQPEGDGFGTIDPFVPPAPPEPEVVEVPASAPEPNAELLAQIAALQAQIEAIQNAPDPVVENDTAAAEAMNALTAQLAELQAASEAAQQQFADELEARDRALQQLRMDLDLARLEAQQPSPAPSGPTEEELRRLEEERLRREDEARRVAELQQRAEEERAFQERRRLSPVIAFGGTTGGLGGDATELAERTFGEVTDFVLNGALPSAVTQSEIIANPSNTVIQGTVIQAALETAISSELAGQVRAITSENIYSYDGARLLIPAGSRLIGRYRSGADIAQRRLTIAWDRIILPTDQTIQISAFGADELGRSGTTGFVDTRFAERFGSAALISLISAAPAVAANQTEDELAEDVLEDIGDDLADATDSVIGEYLSIGPVIYVDQGARITVMVDRDLEIF